MSLLETQFRALNTCGRRLLDVWCTSKTAFVIDVLRLSRLQLRCWINFGVLEQVVEVLAADTMCASRSK